MSIAKTIPFIVLMVKSGQMKLHVRWRTHKSHEPKQTALPKDARLTADVFIVWVFYLREVRNFTVDGS